jgi:hypothetical protein
MRDYLDIFADVLRITTFQHRPGTYHADFPRTGDRPPSRQYRSSPGSNGVWPSC